MMKCLKLLLLTALISLISHFSYANMPANLLDSKTPNLAHNQSNNLVWRNEHQEIDCLTATLSQQNMNQCLQRQAQYSTQQLNQLLTEIQQIFGNNPKQWLRFNQLNHKWKQLREQICLLEKATFGVGLVAPMIYHNCITFYNNQYLEKLNDVLYTTYQNQSYWNHPN